MMKNIFKNISLLMGILLVLFTACDPILDRDELKNTTDVNGVELVAAQSTEGGNEIELSMVTPGITGYWDYNLGKALTNKISFVYPIPGKATFTFTGTLGAEFFEKTIDVQIDVLDHPLDQAWYDLVSENTTAGKKWVFDTDNTAPDNGNMWWYMSPPGDKNGWATAWWNAGGTCCPPGDANGSMTFNLDGAANYIYDDGNGNVKTASFVLDTTNDKIKLIGESILGYDADRVSADGVYEIVSLTSDKLILYTPSNGGGTGWTWIFKPAE